MQSANLRWKVVVVGTDQIFDEFYASDPDFDKQNWIFLNVSEKRIAEKHAIDVLNSCDISGYVRFGRQYAESEAIYNVYKLKLFSDCDYIGFIHYDFKPVNPKTGVGATRGIEDALQSGAEWVSFQSMLFATLYGRNDILLDERDPNCMFRHMSTVDNPRSCFDYILKHVNAEYGLNFEVSAINPVMPVNICCSFLVARRIFDRIGRVFESIMDEHYVDKFDARRLNRIPGNVMERCLAIVSALYSPMRFDLTHASMTNKQVLSSAELMRMLKY